VTITGFSHWSLCVSDLEASVAFYRDVLGCRVVGRDAADPSSGSPPGAVTAGADVKLVRDGQRIELVQQDRPVSRRDPKPETNHLGVSHLTVATGPAPEVMGALAAMGVHVRTHTLANFVPAEDRAGTQFLFEDPDGNLIETYTPGETWNVFPGTAEGDGDPVSSGITHFSHLSLCVADPASALPFYQDVLGWGLLAALDWAGPGPSRVMDVGPARLTTWLMAAGDQRVELIHFADPPSPQRSQPPVDQLGLSHFTVLVDDVDSSIGELVGRGVTVRGAASGTDPAGSAAVLFEDPDGNLIKGVPTNGWDA
jgi:catechol 2,3-dioxygenase-like lactoylglutathione lyase family enzyme